MNKNKITPQELINWRRYHADSNFPQRCELCPTGLATRHIQFADGTLKLACKNCIMHERIKLIDSEWIKRPIEELIHLHLYRFGSDEFPHDLLMFLMDVKNVMNNNKDSFSDEQDQKWFDNFFLEEYKKRGLTAFI